MTYKNLLIKYQYKLTNIFTLLYLIIFFIIALSIKNTEFAGYIFLFFLVFIFTYAFLDKYVRKYLTLYSAASAFLLLHILGGVIYFGDTRMYDYYFFELFRYDWFMHLLGGLLSGRIAYEIVKENFLYTKDSYQLFIIIIIILSLGVGTINEILEFMAVIFLDAEKAVGDYYNNLTDICNNLLGSIIYLLLFSKTHVFQDTEFENLKVDKK
jgi:hypothetical protein